MALNTADTEFALNGELRYFRVKLSVDTQSVP